VRSTGETPASYAGRSRFNSCRRYHNPMNARSTGPEGRLGAVSFSAALALDSLEHAQPAVNLVGGRCADALLDIPQ
jgi:hypothetical protein